MYIMKGESVYLRTFSLDGNTYTYNSLFWSTGDPETLEWDCDAVISVGHHLVRSYYATE